MISLRDLPPIVTYKELRSTFHSERKNNSWIKKTEHFLRRRDLLPLTLRSPRLPQLNLLVAALWYHGALGLRDYQADGILFIKGRAREFLEENISERLGITFTHPSDPGNKSRLYFGEHGKAYARLIAAMDGSFYTSGNLEERCLPNQTKRDQDFPTYLKFLRDNFNDLDQEGKDIARTLIQGHIQMLLYTRFKKKKSKSHYGRIQLFEHETSEKAKLEATRILTLFEEGFPHLDVKETDLRITQSRIRQTYIPRISLRAEVFQNAATHYPGLFLPDQPAVLSKKLYQEQLSSLEKEVA